METIKNNETVESAKQAVLNRRAALRKIGLTAGASLLTALSIDDLARNVIRRLQEQDKDNALLTALDKEFATSGIAFADNICPHCSAQWCVDSNNCSTELNYCWLCESATKTPQSCVTDRNNCMNDAEASWTACINAHCPSGQQKPTNCPDPNQRACEL